MSTFYQTGQTGQTGQIGQTGQTKLTFKLDFPGNQCLAAFAILALFLLHCTNSISVPPVINFMVLLLALLPAIGTEHKCLVTQTLIYFVQQLSVARENSTFIMAKNHILPCIGEKICFLKKKNIGAYIGRFMGYHMLLDGFHQII